MRERLARDTGATYTYSMDYVSQTVSLVDEFRVKEDQEVNVNIHSDRRFLHQQGGLSLRRPRPSLYALPPYKLVIDDPTLAPCIFHQHYFQAG